MVLGRVIDRLRVNIWFRSILGRVWRLGHLAFCLVLGGIRGSSWFLELLASYSGDDIGTPGIRGNEENLTFLWSSLMVENSDSEDEDEIEENEDENKEEGEQEQVDGGRKKKKKVVTK
ncbi:hypothetical protein DY000_02050558 [Brassica cretica]|uniref:Uncharacterized protein n=1 Tax=Brassica cretica TaxID=69181 RepID=A0ABQ7F775_BRACR|nr:hypothetical protein DY000_02050558 [Brassica cretica]